jgi:hypothetical protein
VLDAVVDLETAIYFSTISYAGIGDNDAENVHHSELIRAIEGVNWTLLLGWPLFIFVAAIARLRRWA